jgi:hypothetical protein
MKLSDDELSKADSNLRQALTSAKTDDHLRVVMILGLPDQPPTENPRPKQFVDRRAYRQALIDQQQQNVKAATGPVLESLKGLGLRISGGNLTRAMVVEGSAKAVASALGLSGIRSAALDVEIDLTKPLKSGEVND